MGLFLSRRPRGSRMPSRSSRLVMPHEDRIGRTRKVWTRNLLEHDLKKDLRHSLARRPRRRRPATRMTQQEELLRGHCRIQAPAAEIVRPRRCRDSWDVEVEFPDHRQTVAFPSNELRYTSEVLRTPVIVQSGYLCKGARVIAVSRSRSTPGRLVPIRKKSVFSTDQSLSSVENTAFRRLLEISGKYGGNEPSN